MKEVFTVRDLKADCYMGIYLHNSTPAAIRSVLDEARNPDSMLARHPEDYVLIRLGTWDEHNGKMELHDTPVPVTTVEDLLPPDNVQELKQNA